MKCSVQRNKTVVREALQLAGLFPCRQRFFTYNKMKEWLIGIPPEQT